MNQNTPEDQSDLFSSSASKETPESRESVETGIQRRSPAGDAPIITERDVALAEEQAGLHRRVIVASIKRTDWADWSDYNDKPYLDSPGCEKLAELWGISIESTRHEREHIEDKKGEYIMYTYSMTVSRKGRRFEAEGTASTRNPFYAMKQGREVPLEDIDLTRVKKHAYTNAFQNAIKRCLGIRSITWEDVQRVFGDDGVRRIREQKAVTFKSKNRDHSQSDDEETAKKRSEIRRACLILGFNDPEKAAEELEKQTTWKKKDGDTVQGKRHVNQLSKKQVEINHRKITEAARKHIQGMGDDGKDLEKQIDERLKQGSNGGGK